MLIRGNRGTYSVRNLRTGPKRSEWKRKSDGRNSVRRTGSSGGKFVSELAQRFELGGDVDGQLGGVHETRELFTGSRRHAHCFSDHDWERNTLVWENLHGNGEQERISVVVFFLGFGLGWKKRKKTDRFVWNWCCTKQTMLPKGHKFFKYLFF